MRNAFASELTALAGLDPRIVLLSGDIGNRLFDEFKESAPRRFLNCGVAEANMTSLAAGLALGGLRPVTYTITSFATVRCLEQIRVDIAYQNLPVVIVGVGGGLSYASLNATHHSCEDIAFLRMLPNMTVLCPADSREVRGALRAALAQPGPVYIRLGKKGEPDIHNAEPDFAIGSAFTLHAGRDLCLLATGTITSAALAAADQLEAKGISAQVLSWPTVKPLNLPLLAALAQNFSVLVTLEEHSVLGGLGGSVAEWLSSRPGPGPRLLRIGTADQFMYEAGEQEHAWEFYRLTPSAIAQQILDFLADTQSR